MNSFMAPWIWPCLVAALMVLSGMEQQQQVNGQVISPNSTNTTTTLSGPANSTTNVTIEAANSTSATSLLGSNSTSNSTNSTSSPLNSGSAESNTTTATTTLNVTVSSNTSSTLTNASIPTAATNLSTTASTNLSTTTANPVINTTTTILSPISPESAVCTQQKPSYQENVCLCQLDDCLWDLYQQNMQILGVDDCPECARQYSATTYDWSLLFTSATADGNVTASGTNATTNATSTSNATSTNSSTNTSSVLPLSSPGSSLSQVIRLWSCQLVAHGINLTDALHYKGGLCCCVLNYSGEVILVKVVDLNTEWSPIYESLNFYKTYSLNKAMSEELLSLSKEALALEFINFTWIGLKRGRDANVVGAEFMLRVLQSRPTNPALIQDQFNDAFSQFSSRRWDVEWVSRVLPDEINPNSSTTIPVTAPVAPEAEVQLIYIVVVAVFMIICIFGAICLSKKTCMLRSWCY